MRTIRTELNRTQFLDLLGETGNVTATAKACGLARTALYHWRDEDPTFAADWEAALALGIEALEDEARRRALAGSDLLMMFLLKGAKPDRYRERATIDVNQTTRVDLRRLPREELVRQLEALREQQLLIEGRAVESETVTAAPMIEGRVVDGESG